MKFKEYLEQTNESAGKFTMSHNMTGMPTERDIKLLLSDIGELTWWTHDASSVFAKFTSKLSLKKLQAAMPGKIELQ